MEIKKVKKPFSFGKRALAAAILYVLGAVLPYAWPISPKREKTLAMLEAGKGANSHLKAAILESGREALFGRLYLIDHAQTEIKIASYLFAADESGRKIASALLQAADRGVQVKILVDGLIGGFNFHGALLPAALGQHENIEIRYYNPLHLLLPGRLNARLHDKYLLADDWGLIMGGRNISDEFLTPESHPDYNSDRDVMLIAEGGKGENAVTGLGGYFDGVWQGDYVSSRFEQAGREEDIALFREEMDALLAEEDREDWYRKIEGEDFFVPVERASLLYNPTNPGRKTPVVWDGLCALMEEAQERIWIQSPYFVLNGQMEKTLQSIGDRASSLKLFTNSMASGNNIPASADGVLQKKRIRAVEGSLYEAQFPWSTHTKGLLIDWDISIFGSFNFDSRSAYIDTEVMLVVYSRPLNERLAECMERVEAGSLLVSGGTYAKKEGLAPQPIGLIKKLLIYGLSPLVLPIRFLL